MKVKSITVAEDGVLLKPEEVAERLGVTLRWVRRAISERRLPVVKVGRLNRIPEQAVDEYIAQNTRPAYHED